MTNKTAPNAIRKGSVNVIDYAKMRANRDAPKAVKPKGSKAKRMALNNSVTGRFPGTHQDNIAAVGMR